jgi:acetyl esterase/lipase
MSSDTNISKQTKRRRWLILIGAIVSLFLGVLVIGQFTPVLTAWILRQPINAWNSKPPPNFEIIEESVVVAKNLVYDGHGTLMDIYRPKAASDLLPVIVWIHGGGFIGGNKENTRAYAMTLASHGYVVANINYDLAPRQKYPGQILQVNQALEYLRKNAMEHGGDINRLFLGSNSAGSQIASELAALISDKEFAAGMGIQPAITREQLKGLLLYDGLYNIRTLTSSPVEDLYLWSYTGQRDYQSYDKISELSVVEHITPEYPPVFLTVGDADPLESQSLELKDVLQRNRVEVEAVLFTGTGAGLGHDYMMELDTEAARQTMDRALEFLERHSQQSSD